MQFVDWLYPLPRGTWDEQTRLVGEWLAADPVAAAISDEEAEMFVAVSYMVRFIDGRHATHLFKACGVRIPHQNERNWRRAVLAVLRLWKVPRYRELLTWLTANVGFGMFKDVATHGHLWTPEFFAEAYDQRTNIVWLVRHKRYLGQAENLTEWLQGLSEWAEQDYRLWLDVGRLTLSRLVYAPAPSDRAMAEAAAGVQVVQTQELREKDRKSGALRQQVRRLEQDRKRLKAAARRAEVEARAMLSQARGEVAAARRQLAEEAAAQEQERAARVREFESRVASLREQVAAARQETRRTLEAMAAAPRAGVLGGRVFTLTGSDEQRQAGRLLVASLGGQVVEEGGEAVLDATAGLAALERQVRRLALSRVLIKCDGNYRRKGRRPGLCMSAFQLYVGGEAGWDDRRVTCCGPLASAMMAEYGAVAMALSWLWTAGLGAGDEAEVWSDCKFMVREVLSRQPGKLKPGCVMLHREVRRLLRQLESRGCRVRLRWVPREQVHAVDRLCAKGYREQAWYHRSRGRVSVPLKIFLGRLYRGSAATLDLSFVSP